jgi:NhaP-type Na+/H+ and K+/H+ antiporter
MSSSILSIVLGAFAFISGIIVVPVLGLAFGANALIKENRKENKRRSVSWLAGIGIFLNLFPIILMLIL